MASAPVQPGSDEAAEVRRDFDRLVNMTANQLQRWLATDESRAVGQKDGGGESVGHASGRRIVAILAKRKDELTAETYRGLKGGRRVAVELTEQVRGQLGLLATA